MTRSDERGIALVVALFMVLILSVLGSSLVFVSRTETFSSLNYKTMSQTRYGAESGVHRAANHLLWTYVPPANPAEMALFDVTASPVRVVANGQPVVLSSHPDFASNYPVARRTAERVCRRGAGKPGCQYRHRRIQLACDAARHANDSRSLFPRANGSRFRPGKSPARAECLVRVPPRSKCRPSSSGRRSPSTSSRRLPPIPAVTR